MVLKVTLSSWCATKSAKPMAADHVDITNRIFWLHNWSTNFKLQTGDFFPNYMSQPNSDIGDLKKRNFHFKKVFKTTIKTVITIIITIVIIIIIIISTTDKEVFPSLVRHCGTLAALCSWPISDNEAVLHTSEDFSVSPSILYLA